MTKEGKGVNFKQFVNKHGYAKGGVAIEIPSQNLEIDPRGKTSIRGRGARLATGDTNDVRGTKAIRADKKPVKVTWY
jgi:hypothetical protein